MFDSMWFKCQRKDKRRNPKLLKSIAQKCAKNFPSIHIKIPHQFQEDFVTFLIHAPSDGNADAVIFARNSCVPAFLKCGFALSYPYSAPQLRCVRKTTAKTWMEEQKCRAKKKEEWGGTALTLLCSFSSPAGRSPSPIRCKSINCHLMCFADGSAVMRIWCTDVSAWNFLAIQQSDKILMLIIHRCCKKKELAPSTANKFIPLTLGQPQQHSPAESKVELSEDGWVLQLDALWKLLLWNENPRSHFWSMGSFVLAFQKAPLTIASTEGCVWNQSHSC